MVFNPQPKPEPKPKKKARPIKKVGSKRAYFLGVYTQLRKDFLKENPYCAVFENVKAQEVHHKRGREHTKFADQWARDNNIPLLIDVRFFLAVSSKAHHKIENNPEWAKENGYSIQRT